MKEFKVYIQHVNAVGVKEWQKCYKMITFLVFMTQVFLLTAEFESDFQSSFLWVRDEAKPEHS